MYFYLQDTLPDAEAKKVTKSIIKIIIKLGILYHNDQLTINEKQILKQMVKRFSRLIMTIVTFWEVGAALLWVVKIVVNSQCSSLL